MNKRTKCVICTTPTLNEFVCLKNFPIKCCSDTNEVDNITWDMSIGKCSECECSIEHVKFAIESVGYPMQNIYFHKGDIRAVNIEDIPIKIANLRLDNDWYELYKFELPIFEPNVTNGGVITIDDYGHWNGCKEAVDDYINGKNINLIKIDYTGVYWIKHT